MKPIISKPQPRYIYMRSCIKFNTKIIVSKQSKEDFLYHYISVMINLLLYFNKNNELYINLILSYI